MADRFAAKLLGVLGGMGPMAGAEFTTVSANLAIETIYALVSPQTNSNTPLVQEVCRGDIP